MKIGIGIEVSANFNFRRLLSHEIDGQLCNISTGDQRRNIDVVLGWDRRACVCALIGFNLGFIHLGFEAHVMNTGGDEIEDNSISLLSKLLLLIIVL